MTMPNDNANENLKIQMRNKFINFINNYHANIHANVNSYKSVVAHLLKHNLDEIEYERQTALIKIGAEHNAPLTNFKNIHNQLYNKIHEQITETQDYINISSAFESYNHFLTASHDAPQHGGFIFLTKDHHDIVDNVLNVVGLSGLSCFGLLIASTTIVLPPIGIVVVGIGCFALATWAIVGGMHAISKEHDEPVELFRHQIANAKAAEEARASLERHEQNMKKIKEHQDKMLKEDMPYLNALKLKYNWKSYEELHNKKGGAQTFYVTYRDILDICKTRFINLRLSKDAKDFIIQFINTNAKRKKKRQSNETLTILNPNSKRFVDIDLQHLETLVIKLINKGMKKYKKEDSKILRAVHFL